MPPPGDGVSLNSITRNGKTIVYLRVTRGPQRNRYVHQLVAEAKLGRALRPGEEVDHNDGDTLNNHWENLVVRDKVEHGRKTRRQRPTTREGAQRARAAQLRKRPVPPEPSEEAPF
jgi:hypothetical protein